GFYGVPAGPYLVLPLFGPSNLRDTGGLVFDFAAEMQINFLNVADVSNDHPEIMLLRAIDRRYVTSFRYGQLNTPFEYEKERYVYTESRKFQIVE
ncbi:MlaA family lipoprotein, partial [Pseudomonas viridiflava]|uniref:MlaA family lipoprotein n=1 Tax=Pseudomonas viridiflava TaxID=33069 RepID=UPI00197E826B